MRQSPPRTASSTSCAHSYGDPSPHRAAPAPVIRGPTGNDMARPRHAKTGRGRAVSESLDRWREGQHGEAPSQEGCASGNGKRLPVMSGKRQRNTRLPPAGRTIERAFDPLTVTSLGPGRTCDGSTYLDHLVAGKALPIQVRQGLTGLAEPPMWNALTRNRTRSWETQDWLVPPPVSGSPDAKLACATLLGPAPSGSPAVTASNEPRPRPSGMSGSLSCIPVGCSRSRSSFPAQTIRGVSPNS